MFNFLKKKKNNPPVDSSPIILALNIARLFNDLISILNQKEQYIPLGIDPYAKVEIKLSIKKIKNSFILYNKNLNIKGFIYYLVNKLKNFRIILIDANNEIVETHYADYSVSESINYILSELYKKDPTFVMKTLTELFKYSCNLTNQEADLLFNVIKELHRPQDSEDLGISNLLDHIKNMVLRTPFENEIRYSLITKLTNVNKVIESIKIEKKTIERKALILPLGEAVFTNSKFFIISLCIHYLLYSASENNILFILNTNREVLRNMFNININMTDLLYNILNSDNIVNVFLVDDIPENLQLKYFNLILMNRKDLNNYITRKLSLFIQKNVINELYHYINKIKESENIMIIENKFIYSIKLYKSESININDNFFILLG
ncbi:MAG: hypothetical protein RXR31_00080 [Thermoproteota archaeon]|jgi:hypothetical protein